MNRRSALTLTTFLALLALCPARAVTAAVQAEEASETPNAPAVVSDAVAGEDPPAIDADAVRALLAEYVPAAMESADIPGAAFAVKPDRTVGSSRQCDR